MWYSPFLIIGSENILPYFGRQENRKQHQCRNDYLMKLAKKAKTGRKR